MNPQNLTSVDIKPQLGFAQKNYTAQKAWLTLRDGFEDVETGLRQYMTTHSKIRPEGFDDSGRYKTRRGFEFLRGKNRKGDYLGGPLGKARVIAGQPLELRRIPFSAIPELKKLEFDPIVQFESGTG
jgi:hypothetical protein